MALERAGADFIIIPCISAHFFLAEIQQQTNLPILSIFDVVADTITRDYPEVKTVGLLGTTGTVEGGLFQKRLTQEKIKTIVPQSVVQSTIMEAIYDIKNVQPSRTRHEITAELVTAAKGLISQKAGGAQDSWSGRRDSAGRARQEFHRPGCSAVGLAY